MASLPKLPVEILDLIAGHLVEPRAGFLDLGICALRLTCRELYSKTLSLFRKSAFPTLRLDLHSKTLQSFSRLCRVPALGAGVKKVIFAQLGDEPIAFPGDIGEEENLFDLREQVLFVLRQVLSEAFQGMPNLEQVVILTPFCARFQRYRHSDTTRIWTDAMDTGKPMLLSVSRECFDLFASPLASLIMEIIEEIGGWTSSKRKNDRGPCREKIILTRKLSTQY